MKPIELILSKLDKVKRSPKGWTALCPAHEDKRPSLSISEGSEGQVLLHCWVGCKAEAITAAIDLALSDLFSNSEKPEVFSKEPTFTSENSRRLWQMARARMKDDSKVSEDSEVYDYLTGRKLDEAWEAGSYGIVSVEAANHIAVKGWPLNGFGLVCPLYDMRGNLTSVQARRVREGKPKVLFPRGACAKSVAFANEQGLAVLRGERPDLGIVILGEGLTDYLALSITTTIPVLCAPGAGSAPGCVGSWARNRQLLLALDCDPPGEKAVKLVSQRAYQMGVTDVARLRWPDKSSDACDALWKLGVPGMCEFFDRLWPEGSRATA